MAINIRKATPADAESIWKLIRELAIFEKSEQEHITTVPQLASDMEQKRYLAFVAEDSDIIVGMALFYPVYSTWKGLSYYLEDIVVNLNYRRSGIGSLLFEAVANFAREEKAGRLTWQVLDWNTSAIAFYKKYGAQLDDEWITCRLNQEQLNTFPQNNK